MSSATSGFPALNFARLRRLFEVRRDFQTNHCLLAGGLADLAIGVASTIILFKVPHCWGTFFRTSAAGFGFNASAIFAGDCEGAYMSQAATSREACHVVAENIEGLIFVALVAALVVLAVIVAWPL